MEIYLQALTFIHFHSLFLSILLVNNAKNFCKTKTLANECAFEFFRSALFLEHVKNDGKKTEIFLVIYAFELPFYFNLY